MQIIPVIDLMDGRVVHARHGDRARYRPLRSVLCGSSDPSANTPLTIVDALLRLHDFSCLYVADLDAIRGLGDNLPCVVDIQHRYPALEIWLDDGLQTFRHEIYRQAPNKRIRPVVGSESVAQARLPEIGAALTATDAPILSLDFQGGTFLGPPDLLADTARWPARVIIMSLARVGSGSGPDLDRLLYFLARSPRTGWYMGGGARNACDLHDLNAAGASGILIASALHNGAIGTAELAVFS